MIFFSKQNSDGPFQLTFNQPRHPARKIGIHNPCYACYAFFKAGRGTQFKAVLLPFEMNEWMYLTVYAKYNSSIIKQIIVIMFQKIASSSMRA
jgi:hypothetical protein